MNWSSGPCDFASYDLQPGIDPTQCEHHQPQSHYCHENQTSLEYDYSTYQQHHGQEDDLTEISLNIGKIVLQDYISKFHQKLAI